MCLGIHHTYPSFSLSFHCALFQPSQHGVQTETIKLAFEEGTLERLLDPRDTRGIRKSHFSSRLRRDRSSRRKSNQQRRSHFPFFR